MGRRHCVSFVLIFSFAASSLLFIIGMTRRRFFADPTAFDLAHQTVELKADEARHLRDVLRLKEGDDAYVFDGVGNEFHCRVRKASRERAELEIVQKVEPASKESPLDLALALAFLKSDKFDLVVQKATELGVTSVLPIVTRYADIHIRDKSDSEKRVNRWRRIALEAAKQCGRAKVPEVSDPVSVSKLFESSTSQSRLLFSERDGESLNQVLSDNSETVASFTAVVGSEGGWSSEELVLAREKGWQLVTLGGRILRAETAAISVVSLLQHLYGDLK